MVSLNSNFNQVLSLVHVFFEKDATRKTFFHSIKKRS